MPTTAEELRAMTAEVIGKMREVKLEYYMNLARAGVRNSVNHGKFVWEINVPYMAELKPDDLMEEYRKEYPGTLVQFWPSKDHTTIYINWKPQRSSENTHGSSSTG